MVSLVWILKIESVRDSPVAFACMLAEGQNQPLAIRSQSLRKHGAVDDGPPEFHTSARFPHDQCLVSVPGRKTPSGSRLHRSWLTQREVDAVSEK